MAQPQAASASGHGKGGGKRLQEDGGGGAAASSERPSKRRRVGDASVLCMRELFRAVIGDGDVSEEERIGLQSAAVLLSQLDGQKWVTLPDTQGELGSLDLSRQQREKLREFLSKVAKELEVDEVSLGDDCVRLATVPWASGGLTAHELLGCLQPYPELQYKGPLSGLLEKVLKPIPSRYMAKDRAHELINFYYLQRGVPEPMDAQPGPEPACASVLRRLDESGERGAALASLLRATAALPGAVIRSALQCSIWLLRMALLKPLRGTMASIGIMVQAVAGCLTYVLAFFSRFFAGSEDPFWPAVRFFIFAFLHGKILRLFEFVVLMARIRVLLCLAHCYPSCFGAIFYPFELIAKRFLRWNEESWLLGCSCDSGEGKSPSLLSFLPVKAADFLNLQLLSAVELLSYVPALNYLHEPLHGVVTGYMQPFIRFVLDLTFSFGFAEGLAALVKGFQDQADPKLVMMSLHISKMLREGWADAASALAAPAPAASAPAESTAVAAAAASTGEAGAEAPRSSPPLPEWDGEYHLFD